MRTQAKAASGMAAVILFLSSAAWAAEPVATASVQLTAVKPESLEISMDTAPTAMGLTGSVSSPATVSWTTRWSLAPSRSRVQVCAYLSAPLSGGNQPAVIPAANIEGRPTAGGSFQPFNGVACGQSNAIQVSNTAVTDSNRKQGSTHDQLALRVDEAGLRLPSGSTRGL